MAARLWERLSCDPALANALAADLKIHPMTARLLCLRGISDAQAAERFLKPALEHLEDPFRLADMGRAVDRLLAALAARERIAIHGDYDVDGITATVIVRRTLEMLGGDVVHFIPERIRDGYDLQAGAVERLHSDGARLIVSVDCGTRSLAAAHRARELGVDLIVTDHHQPDAELPRALAVINPKRPDSEYPDRNLAGAGVALKLVQALCQRTNHESWLPGVVKMAAIGTLADVVPLVGENRVIAKLGLEMLSRGPHKVGLRALLQASGLTGRAIDSYHVAFMLAPRVNAAGRMGTADTAMRLLLATDESMAAEARELAARLNDENVRRQKEEQAIVAEARRIVETDPAIGGKPVLVVASPGWHRGIIGIVASKLVDTFYRPAIVLTVEESVAHGSCRSVPAFDMIAALEHCRSHLSRFGGHRQAAGLTLATDQIGPFRDAIAEWADATLGPDDLRPRVRIDAPLPLASISGDLVGELATLEPHGPGNPRPVFCAAGVQIVDGPRRLKDRHLKMAVRQAGRTFRAVAWRAGEREAFYHQHREAVDLAFSLVQNEYNGQRSVEISVADARPPSSVDDWR